MKELIHEVVDRADFSIQGLGAQHHDRLRRMEGRAIGIVANQYNVLAGVLDSERVSGEGAHFVASTTASILQFHHLRSTSLSHTIRSMAAFVEHGADYCSPFAEQQSEGHRIVSRRAYTHASGDFLESISSNMNYAWPSAGA